MYSIATTITPKIKKFKISGSIKTDEGVASGVSVKFTSATETVISTTSGDLGAYSIENVIYGSTGTITVSKTGYTDATASISEPITNDVTKDIEINIKKLSLSGTITLSSGINFPSEGVTGSFTPEGKDPVPAKIEADGTTLTKGNLSFEQTFSYGTKGSLSIAYPGYTFTAKSYTIDKDITDTYLLNAISYTVKYDKGDAPDGSGVMDSQTVSYDDSSAKIAANKFT